MRYLETRHLNTASDSNLLADIMKHLQSRQYLGQAVIVCDKPSTMISVSRKSWLRQARTLQKDRAGTADTEKILRLTKSITHMQRLQFAAKRPELQPSAQVFFITPEEAAACLLPVETYSLYLTVPLELTTLTRLVEQLPHDALVTDYTGASNSFVIEHLRSKQLLETQAHQEWRQVTDFLAQNAIKVELLTNRHTADGFRQVDNALDTLLGVNRGFLQVAANFQHAFELAQPFRFPSEQQKQYEVFLLLAHQVQALTPLHPLAKQLSNEFIQNETFFLHDSAPENATFTELLANVIDYHQKAGRVRLARALAFMAYS